MGVTSHQGGRESRVQGEGAQVVQTPGGVQASVMLIADPVPGVVHAVNQERLESDVPGNSYASFGGGRLEKCLDIADILGSRGNSLAAYPTSEPYPGPRTGLKGLNGTTCSTTNQS